MSVKNNLNQGKASIIHLFYRGVHLSKVVRKYKEEAWVWDVQEHCFVQLKTTWLGNLVQLNASRGPRENKLS